MSRETPRESVSWGPAPPVTSRLLLEGGSPQAQTCSGSRTKSDLDYMTSDFPVAPWGRAQTLAGGPTSGTWRERWGATLWTQLWNLSVHTDRATTAGGGFVSARLPGPESPVGRPQRPGASRLHAEGALLHLYLQKQRKRCPGWLCPPHIRGHHRGSLSSVQRGLHSQHHTRCAEDTGPPRGVHCPARRTSGSRSKHL